MATVAPTTVDEHVALVKATAPKYLKGASDQTIRRRLWLAELRRLGLISYGNSSHSCTWDVEYSQPEVTPYGDGGDLEFNEHDAFIQLTLDWRGYTATDKLTKKQQLMNKGQTAIVNLYKTKTDRLLKTLRQRINGELFTDGYAAGNENRLVGIKSFLADDGATVATDIIANPVDTYAGQSTALGAAGHGGAWSANLPEADRPNANVATDWPYGTGDSEYDCLAPLLVNYSSTSWQAAGTAFQDTCEEAMRFAGLVMAQKNGLSDSGSAESSLSWNLSADLMQGFKNFHSQRNRIITPHKGAMDLGFDQTLNFEGMKVGFEYDVEPQTGYFGCPNMVELASLQDSLFEPTGPEFAIQRKAYLYEIGMFANLRFQTKAWGRIASYA